MTKTIREIIFAVFVGVFISLISAYLGIPIALGLITTILLLK